MLFLIALACTSPKSTLDANVPDATASTPSDPTADLFALQHDKLCGALEACMSPTSEIDDLMRSIYDQLWDAECDSGTFTSVDCEVDEALLRQCVEGEWGCDANGLVVPIACEHVCIEDGDPPEPESCGRVVEHLGAPGAPLVHRNPFRFRFDVPDASAGVSFEVDGSYYGGITTWEGDVMTSQPNPAPPPGSTVNGHVTSCGGREDHPFQSHFSDHGAPLVAPAAGAYAIDLSEGTFVQPPGLGSLVEQELERALLLGIEEAGSDLMTRLAEAGPTGAPLCSGGASFGLAGFDAGDPWLDVTYGSVTLPRTTVGEGVVLYDVRLTGAFDAQATEIAGVTLTGLADARSVVDEDCQALLGPFGLSCVNCPDGDPSCVEVEITDLRASYQWWVGDLQADFSEVCE